MNQTRSQAAKISRLKKRIQACVLAVEEDPEKAVEWIMHLVFSEQIRALNQIKPIYPQLDTNDHPMAMVAKSVSRLGAMRHMRKIQDQIDWITALLKLTGAKRRSHINYEKAAFRGTKGTKAQLKRGKQLRRAVGLI